MKKNTNTQILTKDGKSGRDFKCKRGQLYYAQLDDGCCVGSEQMKDRLVLIVQNNTGNKYSPTVIVALATAREDKRRDLPTHRSVYVRKLGKRNMILTEQLRTIDKMRLIEYVDRLSNKEMAEVDSALSCSLGLARREPYERT